MTGRLALRTHRPCRAWFDIDNMWTTILLDLPAPPTWDIAVTRA